MRRADTKRFRWVIGGYLVFGAVLAVVTGYLLGGATAAIAAAVVASLGTLLIVSIGSRFARRSGR